MAMSGGGASWNSARHLASGIVWPTNRGRSRNSRNAGCARMLEPHGGRTDVVVLRHRSGAALTVSILFGRECGRGDSQWRQLECAQWR